MPLVVTAELAMITGEAPGAIHRGLSSLLAEGIAGRVNHGTARLSSNGRDYRTATGITEAAGIVGFDAASNSVRAYPVLLDNGPRGAGGWPTRRRRWPGSVEDQNLGPGHPTMVEYDAPVKGSCRKMARVALHILLVLTVSLALSACSSGEKVIKIGAAVSETGRYAEEGQHTREGYLLWEDWVNNEYGGIDLGGDRYQVELIMYDDKGEPGTTARLVEQLIDENEVDFLLGPYSSTLTERAIEVAEARGVILVEGNGASETLFEQSYQNLFAVLTPAGSYAESALRLLSDHGARSVVIAYADALFPRSVAEGAELWAERYGMEVLAVQGYPQDVTDVGDIVSSFRDLDPDVFVGAGYFNDAVLFVRTAKDQDFNPNATVLTVGPTNPAFANDVGVDANYLIGPTQWESSMGYQGEYFGSASDYAERYLGKWGDPPAYQAASATAAALALHTAIEAAGSLDADAVRTALRNLDISTFYGPIKLDAAGKNTAKPMGAVQIQDGETLLVAPANAAVSEVLYPAPSWKDR